MLIDTHLCALIDTPAPVQNNENTDQIFLDLRNFLG